VSVGDASYATYLSHEYVTQGVRKILFERLNLININSVVGTSITLILALVAGGIIYKFIDKPLMQLCKSQLINWFALPLKKVSIPSRPGAPNLAHENEDSAKGTLAPQSHLS